MTIPPQAFDTIAWYHCDHLGTPMVAVWQHEYDALNQRASTLRPDGHKVGWLTYGSGHLLGMTLDHHEMLAYERDDLHREVVRQQGNPRPGTWSGVCRSSGSAATTAIHAAKAPVPLRRRRPAHPLHATRRGPSEYQYYLLDRPL
ncbi:hypothetical protein PVLB_09950 [Pseudomonas sp. VLB120]|nr:hypothetical protein [Pseudomonas sp. VLB120]AGZ34786.1 hypothetical protein PVLB_09950 [Pseudomonas sp. VLB120]